MAITLPVKLNSKAVQAVTQRNAVADEVDVTIVCEDGSVHHIWYRGKAGWVGHEVFGAP